jgi:LytS/YehU family sensor histidine kinase
VYGAAVGGFSVLLWYRFSKEHFTWNSFYKFIAVCVFAVIVFTLIYEILFLSKERELDSKLVTEMDKELTQAELAALHNEMDPHFLFNSLNAMGALIMSNPMQAHLFNSNLSLVYKYFLLNKNKELIPLREELGFLDNYFFLLQIRYNNKLRLQVDGGLKTNNLMIPPCALQLLLENAIKHNAFSESEPLNINVVANEQYLKISNTLRPKPYAANSTHTGLKNLSSRFRLISKKDIVVETGPGLFTVKLPIIKETQNL